MLGAVGFDVPFQGAKNQPWHRDFPSPPETYQDHRITSLAFNLTGVDVTEDAVRGVLPVERAPTAAPLPDPAALDRSLSDTLDEYERMLIARALSMAGGNVAEAARKLKTDRPNLYRRMKRLGIGPAESEG